MNQMKSYLTKVLAHIHNGKHQYSNSWHTSSLLQNLNIHKASGPDRISTTLLKETAEVTAPILKLH